MGLRVKKKNQRRVLSRRSTLPKTGKGKDFLLLEGKGQRIREKKQPEEPESKATVLYISQIPHGFYEVQMQGFFQQFGVVKRVSRIIATLMLVVSSLFYRSFRPKKFELRSGEALLSKELPVLVDCKTL